MIKHFKSDTINVTISVKCDDYGAIPFTCTAYCDGHVHIFHRIDGIKNSTDTK